MTPQSSKPEPRVRSNDHVFGKSLFGRKRVRASVQDVEKYLDAVNLARLEQSRKEDLRGF